MSAAKLRVGVVGASFGGIVHVPAFAAQGRFEVVAIASPNSAAAVAAERGVPHAFSSTEAMLAGVELDVLAVASPPFDHRSSVLAGLACGKHILCEKPFGLNVAEAEEMLRASQRAGTVCALAHEFRYTSARAAMCELIANGHLGALREIEITSNMSMLRAHAERKPSWWFEKARGGGVAGAILSHLVDLANWLAGRPPLHSTGYLRTANPRRISAGAAFTSTVDDGAFALADYGEGLIGRIVADATLAVPSATIAVHGELRTTVSSGANLVEMTMFTVDEEETAELELTGEKHAKLATIHPNLPPFVALLDEFAQAIDGKPATYPTFADGLATQRVLQSVGYETVSRPPGA